MTRMMCNSFKYAVTVALSAVLTLTFWGFPAESISQGGPVPTGTVAAIQGEGLVTLEGEQQENQLQSGDLVQAWNAISSGQNSRVYLQWDSGVATSLGDFSSIFLSPEDTPTGEMKLFQIMEGIVRVAGSPFKGATER